MIVDSPQITEEVWTALYKMFAGSGVPASTSGVKTLGNRTLVDNGIDTIYVSSWNGGGEELGHIVVSRRWNHGITEVIQGTLDMFLEDLKDLKLIEEDNVQE